MEPNNDHDAIAAVAAANNDDANEGVDDDEEEQNANDRRLINKAILILQERLDFPFRTRNTIVELAQQFVDGVGDDIKDMITDTRSVEEGYEGLDSDRDTEKEVEKAIRFYPESLTRRGGQFGEIPCQCLMYMYDNTTHTYLFNVKAASFIHLFVSLAIKFNSFEEEERGGLLFEDDIGEITLQFLVHFVDNDHQQRNDDTTCLAVLIRLRQSGLLKKEDIQQYELVHRICLTPYFSEHKFRFFAEWCPESLIQINENEGILPLHWAANNDQSFRLVLDAVFRYYPRWRGLHALFRMRNYNNDSSFEMACKKLTRTTTIDIVEETLNRYSNTTPLNMHNAFMLAAIDDRIHLDCLYFLTRRHPDVMLGMLRQRSGTINNQNDGNDSRSTNNTDGNTAVIDHHNTDNNNDDAVTIASANNNDNTISIVLRRSTRKRKRTNKN